MNGFYTQPATDIPVYGHYDVIVAGGGCAGFAAAVCSADGCSPRNADIKTVQERLIRQGAEIGQGRTR